MIKVHKLLLLLFTLLGLIQPALTQEKIAAALQVKGEVVQPLQLTLRDLQAMSRDTIHFTDKNGQLDRYEGVPVPAILQKAGVTLGKDLRGKNLNKYLLVKAADGYQVVFSLAELDSSFTHKKMILADQLGGKPLSAERGPFRLIVSGEKIPARSCYQVIEFFVGRAKEE